jgi:uracil-DNA glycosylase
MRPVRIVPSFEAWQDAARALLRDRFRPEDVDWIEITPEPDEPAGGTPPASTDTASSPVTRVPRAFVELARRVAAHADPGRWALLYRALWRIVHEDHDLLAHDRDPDVSRLRAIDTEASAMSVSARRPVPSATSFPSGPSGGRTGADPVAAGPLFAEADASGARSFIPAAASLEELRDAGRRCAGCELHRHATQMVFGRGPIDARVVLVGEQPGDQEDREGAPFVGPAGEVLDRALAELRVDRQRLYVTNVVKHFKFIPRGKRRIHQTPGPTEVLACRPWLEAELGLIHPEALVCLGATAAQALLGPGFRLMREHGQFRPTRWCPRTMATIHPSAVLRGEDESAQARLYRMLVDDLHLVAPVV